MVEFQVEVRKLETGFTRRTTFKPYGFWTDVISVYQNSHFGKKVKTKEKFLGRNLSCHGVRVEEMKKTVLMIWSLQNSLKKLWIWQ